MAWGQQGSLGVDDLVQRLKQNDAKLTSLTLLRQRKCGDEEVKKLAEALSTNTVLKELCISSHAVSPQAAQQLSEMLTTNTTITTICIGDSVFGDAGVAALSPGIGASSSVTSVDMSHKGVGTQGAGALGAALSSSRTLTSLNLSHNTLGDAGLSALCTHPWAPSLTCLDLRDCQLGGEGLNALAACPATPALTSLSLSHNALKGEVVGQALAKLVEAATSLQTLLLDHTELGEDTVAALASALGSGHCARLRHLSLASAGVTDTGAAALAAALAARTHLGHLHSLSLEGNKGVTDAFCGALAGGAPAACPHTLDLSSSGVSSAALEPLSTLPTLHKLALLGCALGDEGATVLARLLPRGFPALEDVGVSGCGIGLAGAGALLGALTAGHGAGVASVEMGSNPVCQDDGLHALIEALREARPGMMVHWRSGDMPGEKQGAPGGAA